LLQSLVLAVSRLLLFSPRNPPLTPFGDPSFAQSQQVFFVFLEILFYLGYKPELHRRLQNRTGKAVAEYRREKAAKERAKGQ